MDPQELDALIDRTRQSVERMRILTEQTLRLVQDSKNATENSNDAAAAMQEAIDQRRNKLNSSDGNVGS